MAERIDHLDVSAVGSVVRIDLPAELPDDAVRRVREAWTDAVIGSAHPDAHVTATVETDLDAMMERLSVDVTLAALSHQRGRLIMLHAAGLVLDDGRVIAFVGPSGRGKTTLTRTLARSLGYSSDETVGVGLDLEVHPYRKPLSLVRDSLPKEQIAPSALGLRGLPDVSLTLAALVLLDRQPDADGAVVESVPLPAVIGDLVPQMSYLPELTNPLQVLAQTAAAVGGVKRVRYAEAETVLGVVPDLLRPDVVDDWRAVGLASQPGPLHVEATDAIEVGDHMIVLTDRMVRVLGGVAPAVLSAVAEGCEDVTAAVVERFGVPPQGDAAQLVAGVVSQLVEDGVLSSS